MTVKTTSKDGTRFGARLRPGPDERVSATLDRVARQTCRIMRVEEASVLVADDGTPESVPQRGRYSTAGFGAGSTIDRGLMSAVLETGEPMSVLDYRRCHWPHAVASDQTSIVGGAVPIRWCGSVHGVLAVATTDLEQPFGADELVTLSDLADLGALAIECSAERRRLESALQDGVELLAAAVDMRDHGTARHAEKVVRLARSAGSRLGLGDEELRELEYAARLHDVGKIGVPDGILRKPGPLDSAEWGVMRRHPISGAEMLKSVPGLEGVAAIVRHHHERYDGTGYPYGLEADEIPLASRIISTCDAYDAMVSDRPYRPALDHDDAVAELRSLAGAQFDPAAVDAVIAALPDRVADGRVACAP